MGTEPALCFILVLPLSDSCFCTSWSCLSRGRCRLCGQRDHDERRGADPAHDDGEGEDDHHRGGPCQGRNLSLLVFLSVFGAEGGITWHIFDDIVASIIFCEAQLPFFGSESGGFVYRPHQ